MREIKFRAWDKQEQRILVGNWRIKFNYGKPASIHEPKSEAMPLHRFDLMQYTGLTDRNGVEIYEGDILEFDDYYFEGIGNGGTGYSEWRRKRREVRFENGMFTVGQDHALAMLIQDARVEDDRYEFEDNEVTGWEVIGNIYENPELLTKPEKEG